MRWIPPSAKGSSLAETPPEQLARASASCIDESTIALTPGWNLRRVALYHRSILSTPKHRTIGVDRVERTETP